MIFCYFIFLFFIQYVDLCVLWQYNKTGFFSNACHAGTSITLRNWRNSMKLRNGSGRWLWLLFLFLLLAYHISYEPVKLKLPSGRLMCAEETLCAPAAPRASEQMLFNRSDGTGIDFIQTVRTRTSRHSAQRVTYFTALFAVFAAFALILHRLLRMFALHIRDIVPRSLQLVRFLHKSDGKASALCFSYKIM